MEKRETGSAWAAGVPQAIALTIVLWSSAFAVIRVALRGLGPGHLALLRFGTACLVLWALVAAQGARGGKWPRVERRDWGLTLLGGALGTTAYHALLNWGQQNVAAGPAAFLIATAPMWGLLLAPLAGEKAARGVWGGVCLALAGVFLISWGQPPQPASPTSPAQAAGFGSLLNPSALLILGAAFAGGASGAIYKKLLGRGQSELHLSAVTTLIGTLLLVPFASGLGHAVAQAPRESVWCALYLGVFPTAIAYLSWAFALKRAVLSRVLPFIYLIPVLASALAWAFLGEVLSPLSLLGGAVVLCGVVLAQGASRRAVAPSST